MNSKKYNYYFYPNISLSHLKRDDATLLNMILYKEIAAIYNF
jgi:hypothetical protein